MPLDGCFTYSIPQLWCDSVKTGQRVLVPFGRNKQYVGIIAKLHDNKPQDYQVKDILQLMDAVCSRESGPWKPVPEKIWLDTMKCFPRFIAEHRRSFGTDGFDRYGWTVRQTECRLFRIGELEYELLEESGKRAVSLHIPSDARLEPDLLNDSVRQAKEFLGRYFPEWKKQPMICESWLLSPKLKELLPPSAGQPRSGQRSLWSYPSHRPSRCSAAPP